MRTIHYEPCPGCAGKGMRPLAQFSVPPNTTTAPFSSPLVVETCPVCTGTGKGKIKEITEP